MKAIISRSQTSRGEEIQVLGTGNNEHQARVSAQTFLKRGMNADDATFGGGELAEIDPEWAQLAATGFVMGVVEQDGRIMVDWESYFRSRGLNDADEHQRERVRRILRGEEPLEAGQPAVGSDRPRD